MGIGGVLIQGAVSTRVRSTQGPHRTVGWFVARSGGGGGASEPSGPWATIGEMDR